MDIYDEIQRYISEKAPHRVRYVKDAFELLPEQDEPRILDIGCGTGNPTLELARLTGGRVTGLDINEKHLGVLEQNIRDEGLSHRVDTVHCSMLEMGFPDGSFDIVWSEGSIYAIGFERGLREWRRLLKDGGFLVVHEMVWLSRDPPAEIFNYWKGVYPGIRTIEENLAKIPGCGYQVIGHFALPEDAWWEFYYGPLEEMMVDLSLKYSRDPHALAILEKERREIELYKKYKSWFGSAYYIMQKG